MGGEVLSRLVVGEGVETVRSYITCPSVHRLYVNLESGQELSYAWLQNFSERMCALKEEAGKALFWA